MINNAIQEMEVHNPEALNEKPPND